MLEHEAKVEGADECDENYLMHEALSEAQAALEGNEVPVGCVFVDRSGQRIIARGANKTNASRNGTQHAEVVAISEAIAKGIAPSEFRDSQLFVTCEPCIMCAAALTKMGVRRVVFGCHNDRFGGNGSILSLQLAPYCRLSGKGGKAGRPYDVKSGVLLSQAVEVFQRFYTTENRRGKCQIVCN
jgi:tRNA-specific adenosine deaminase 2